jgi:hypothetical protein
MCLNIPISKVKIILEKLERNALFLSLPENQREPGPDFAKAI